MSDVDLVDLANEYHQQLLASDKGLEYYSTFGVDEKMMAEFKLGWVDEPILPQHHGLTDSSIVPYLSVGGRVMCLRHNPFLHDEVGSYESGWMLSQYPLADTNKHLFNVRHALAGLRTPEVYLASDVLSTIMLRQHGCRSVGVPGYQNWHWPWLELFASANIIIVVSESESEAADVLAARFRRRMIPVRTLMLPAGDRAWYHLGAGGSIEELNQTFASVGGTS